QCLPADLVEDILELAGLVERAKRTHRIRIAAVRRGQSTPGGTAPGVGPASLLALLGGATLGAVQRSLRGTAGCGIRSLSEGPALRLLRGRLGGGGSGRGCRGSSGCLPESRRGLLHLPTVVANLDLAGVVRRGVF